MTARDQGACFTDGKQNMVQAAADEYEGRLLSEQCYRSTYKKHICITGIEVEERSPLSHHAQNNDKAASQILEAQANESAGQVSSMFGNTKVVFYIYRIWCK